MPYLTAEEITGLEAFVRRKEGQAVITLAGIKKLASVTNPTDYGKRLRQTCEEQPERIPFLRVHGYTTDSVTGRRKPETDGEGHIYYDLNL